VCGSTNEFTAALGDAETTINMPAMLTQDYSCTYKITTTSGAPGFTINTAAAAGKILVGWVEYGMDEVTGFTNTSTWPALNT